MPLHKRILFDALTYRHPELVEDSTADTVTEDTNMSRLVVAVAFPGFLCSFVVDNFLTDNREVSLTARELRTFALITLTSLD